MTLRPSSWLLGLRQICRRAGALVLCAGALCCGDSSNPTSPVPLVVSSPTPTPTPAPPAGYPPFPVLIAPPEGAVLDSFPRTVTLEWAAVSDPTGIRFYRVEIELGYTSSPNQWDPIPDSSGYYGPCAGYLPRTSCTTASFPGANPGRWRVIVANGLANETASVWRAFRFTR